MLVRLKILIIHWKQYLLGTVLSTFHSYPCKAGILLPSLQCRRASLVAPLVKNLLAMDLGSIPGLETVPGEGKATHSSILDWRIPWIVQFFRDRKEGLASCFSQLAVDLSFLPECVELQNFCLTTVVHKPLLKSIC